MSNRCASCGDLNPRRSRNAPGPWATYLQNERDVSAVGRIVVPLCRGCASEAQDLGDEVDDDVRAFLDGLETDSLVDDVQG